MLADNGLIGNLLKGVCSWRIDFACDSVVLAVGIRAPEVSRAEKDWSTVLADYPVRIGRANENVSPIGYRTLLVWKLEEQRRQLKLSDRLVAKTEKVVDDVERLTPLLKQGEIDYAFVYRSTCIAHDLRYIELDRNVNLGAYDVDYQRAEVAITKQRAGRAETMTVRGTPIFWTVSIPDEGARTEAALRFLRLLLVDQVGLIEHHGLTPIPRPRFFGDQSKYTMLADVAEYAGVLT
jgi:molybdate/tungstate transport system substrate-binding protein